MEIKCIEAKINIVHSKTSREWDASVIESRDGREILVASTKSFKSFNDDVFASLFT